MYKSHQFKRNESELLLSVSRPLKATTETKVIGIRGRFESPLMNLAEQEYAFTLGLKHSLEAQKQAKGNLSLPSSLFVAKIQFHVFHMCQKR